MTKKLILHIGFNKTGSTSLQKNLALNTEALAGQGFLYPYQPAAPFMQRWQHVPLAAAVPGRKVHWLSKTKRPTLEGAWESLFDHVNGRDFHTLIISSESFGGVDMDAAKVEWVGDRLEGFDVTVLAYIRRQDSYYLSTYQEGIKAGTTEAFDFDRYPTVKGLHFANRLAPWRQVFGPGHVKVRPFAPALWPEGELFHDFLTAIGAGREGIRLAEPENEGLDYRIVEMLRRLNLLSPGSAGRKRRQAHLALVKDAESLLPRDFVREKMQLSSEQAEILREHFRADNEAALEGSGFTADDLFPPVKPGIAARLLPEALDEHILLHLLSATAKSLEPEGDTRPAKGNRRPAGGQVARREGADGRPGKGKNRPAGGRAKAGKRPFAARQPGRGA